MKAHVRERERVWRVTKMYDASRFLARARVAARRSSARGSFKVGESALLFVVDELLVGFGGELVVGSLDDGVDGTGLLTEAAVDALGHVDVVPRRLARACGKRLVGRGGGGGGRSAHEETRSQNGNAPAFSRDDAKSSAPIRAVARIAIRISARASRFIGENGRRSRLGTGRRSRCFRSTTTTTTPATERGREAHQNRRGGARSSLWSRYIDRSGAIRLPFCALETRPPGGAGFQRIFVSRGDFRRRHAPRPRS